MKLVAKTIAGLENILEEELVQLGAKSVVPVKRAVEFEGGLETMYRANLHSRTAMAILWPIYEFRARNEKELYDNLLKFEWHEHLDVEQTFRIKSIVNSPYFNHSQYCAYLTKDALVDAFRARIGKRPNVSAKEAQITFVIKINHDQVTLLLDSSGPPLNRRGYRIRQGPAPINEVLAAGLILLSGWDKTKDFLDPMCGSGTLAIEAAMMAADIPPQAMRKSFSFQHWKNYDTALWNKVRMDWEEKPPTANIIARDEDPDSIALAKQHAEKIDVDQYITFETSAFEDTSSSIPLHMIMNPPYDERIDIENIEELYGTIGSTLKHNYPGCSAWILSANFPAMKKIGLRPSKKLNLYNGQLECKYYGFELFAGKRKSYKKNNGS